MARSSFRSKADGFCLILARLTPHGWHRLAGCSPAKNPREKGRKSDLIVDFERQDWLKTEVIGIN